MAHISDDADAKAVLVGVISAAGLRAVDAGALKRARELEAVAFLQLTLAAGERTSADSPSPSDATARDAEPVRPPAPHPAGGPRPNGSLTKGPARALVPAPADNAP